MFQLEYAGMAAENSGTSVAIRTKDVIVFAEEKIVTNKLYENIRKEMAEMIVDRALHCSWMRPTRP